jgi:hypothetical protein
MTVEEAYTKIEELKGRFDSPFSNSDKESIKELYYEVLGKTFVPTSCQQCYHDALIEVYVYLKKNGKMAEKCNYRLKAGAIICCPNFNNGEVYCNDNLTDEVAAEYLEQFPEQESLFQQLPEEDDNLTDEDDKTNKKGK